MIDFYWALARATEKRVFPQPRSFEPRRCFLDPQPSSSHNMSAQTYDVAESVMSNAQQRHDFVMIERAAGRDVAESQAAALETYINNCAGLGVQGASRATSVITSGPRSPSQ